MEWPRGVNCAKTAGGRTFCTLHQRGSQQGLYERFLIRNLTGIVHLHRRDGTEMGPSMLTLDLSALYCSVQ